ncbi:MAG: hypothetical protein AAF628_16845 [Planctomycetota bacterium]
MNVRMDQGISQALLRPLGEAGDGALRVAKAGAKTAAAVQSVDGELLRSGASDGVDSMFRDQFAAQAENPEEFHALMKQVFGDGYDRVEAESLRQRALDGDFSFLPEVRYVGSESLGGANGAYDQEAGVVYINEDLKGTELAQSTFVEEAGHHIDTLVNGADTAGDEGEMFRRLMSGEKLSDAQIADIRAENDMGTITVDGKQIEVEFWGLGDAWDSVKDAAKSVGNAVKDAAGKVADGVKDVAEGVADAGKKAVEGVVDATWGAGKALGKGLYDFGANIGKGNFVDAFGSLGKGVLDAGRKVVDGVDKVAFQAPQRVINGAIDGTQKIFNGATGWIPGSQYLHEVTDRVFDSGRSIHNAVFGSARDLFRAPAELGMDFVQDLGKSAGHLLRGEFGEAGKAFGGAFWNFGKGAVGRVMDIGIRNLHAVADVVGMAIGQPPSRGLSEDETRFLRQIYGDSLDYDSVRIRQGGITDLGMTAHVVGNTAYMPKEYFNEDGTLTRRGMGVLGHEAGHIWQNQNGGGDYIHEALFAQLGAMIEEGDRNGAYDYVEAMRAGTSFEDMNPEEQASIAEDIGIALMDDGQVTRDEFANLTDDEFDFMMEAWEKIRSGEGAP